MENITLNNEITINSLIPKVKEKFPLLSDGEILKILRHGWTRYYRYNLMGGDVEIKSYNNKYWFYTGQLTKNSINWFNYYRFKLSKRLRMMYTKKKIKWDGYYYFAITKDEYKKYFEVKRRGPKRKIFPFENKKLYKIPHECRLKYIGCKAIIKIKHHTDLGPTSFKHKLECERDNMEFWLIREKPDTFKDILVETNNYNDIL